MMTRLVGRVKRRPHVDQPRVLCRLKFPHQEQEHLAHRNRIRHHDAPTSYCTRVYPPDTPVKAV